MRTEASLPAQDDFGETCTSDLAPILLREVDVSQPLPDLSFPRSTTGRQYESIRCLVRLHTLPLGFVDLKLDGRPLSARECAQKFWQVLGDQINEHLRQDGLPPAAEPITSGFPALADPACLIERHRVLADAPLVSVVIGTRNRPASVEAVLRALAALHYPRFEVIVVDNAPSSEETRDVVKRICTELPSVRYTREDRPGLARARNRGLALARGEIVAITDDDVLPDPNWLVEIVRGFEAGPRVACVTGSILPLELETPAQLLVEQFGGFHKGFHRRIFDQDENRPPDLLYPYAAGTFGSGANIAFRTGILRQMGGFDVALGAGTVARSGEELAVFVQLINNGHQIVYQPAAIIYHGHHRAYEALRRQIQGYGIGITAYLTKCLLDDPRLLFDLCRKIPGGVLYALSPRSPKNRKRGAGYPKELVRVELKGMLSGPIAYLRSRYQSR